MCQHFSQISDLCVGRAGDGHRSILAGRGSPAGAGCQESKILACIGPRGAPFPLFSFLPRNSRWGGRDARKTLLCKYDLWREETCARFGRSDKGTKSSQAGMRCVAIHQRPRREKRGVDPVTWLIVMGAGCRTWPPKRPPTAAKLQRSGARAPCDVEMQYVSSNARAMHLSGMEWV